MQQCLAPVVFQECEGFWNRARLKNGRRLRRFCGTSVAAEGSGKKSPSAAGKWCKQDGPATDFVETVAGVFRVLLVFGRFR